jgi:hypothetical protein
LVSGFNYSWKVVLIVLGNGFNCSWKVVLIVPGK